MPLLEMDWWRMAELSGGIIKKAIILALGIPLLLVLGIVMDYLRIAVWKWIGVLQ